MTAATAAGALAIAQAAEAWAERLVELAARNANAANERTAFLPGGRDRMRLTLIRTDPVSNETNCPALYRTDTGSYVVVGRLLADTSDIYTGLAPGEAAVDVPAAVLDGPTTNAPADGRWPVNRTGDPQ